MEHRKFEVKNSVGEKLVCIEVKPKDQSGTNFPIVILCHGFAYFKEEDGIFTEVAKRLAAKGYAVYYFDFSGCGESEGDYTSTTLTKLVGDLKSILQTVTSFDYNDANNVSMMSHSFGSNVIIAAQIVNVKRLVLSGSFTNPRKVIGAIFSDFNENGISTRPTSAGTYSKIGPQFWQDLKQYDITKLIQKFDCPILFIHGKKDNIVPIENMKPLLEVAKYAVAPVFLDKSDHDLQPQREIAFQAVTEFFDDQTTLI